MAGGRTATAKDASPLRMRAICFEEVPEVLRLVRRAVEHGCLDHYNAPQRDAVYISYAQNLFVEALGPYETIAAERQGRVIGIAQFDPLDNRLRALFVDAGYQKRGVGRALLADIENRAKRHGADRLHGAMSLNAVAFYLRAGFRPCGGPERLVSASILVPVLRMEKDLRADSRR
jgi:putative acetyltransferase